MRGVDRQYPTAMTASSSKDRQAIPRAAAWAILQTQQVGGVPLLYGPDRHGIEHNAQVSQLLAAGFPARTWRTLRSSRERWGGGVAVALWPDQQHLGEIADHHVVRALVVVPWLNEEVAAWAAANSPELLGEASAAATPKLDPVVAAGLTTLTALVNHANNLAGSMDKRDALAVLLTLHDGGYRLEPEMIYAWALQHGWPARGAERLKDHAERIQGGVRPRVATWPLRADILQQWQTEARDSR